ncbi:MAG: AgmX/PglI C-terminal domain-containing protein [Chitinivibrionales bacterium]|nr:AgmX/PglI C-terminal domain-containing protein [Chitinivibrionales bacterium]
MRKAYSKYQKLIYTTFFTAIATILLNWNSTEAKTSKINDKAIRLPCTQSTEPVPQTLPVVSASNSVIALNNTVLSTDVLAIGSISYSESIILDSLKKQLQKTEKGQTEIILRFDRDLNYAVAYRLMKTVLKTGFRSMYIQTENRVTGKSASELLRYEPASSTPKGETLDLSINLDENEYALAAKGAMLPPSYFKVFHRYYHPAKRKSFVVEHKVDAAVTHPRTGKDVSEQARFERLWFICPQKDTGVTEYYYTKNGNLLIDLDQKPVANINSGDTVFILQNPPVKKYIEDVSSYHKKPLVAEDKVFNIMLRIRGRFHDAVDINRIVISGKDTIPFEKFVHFVSVARLAGFTTIVPAIADPAFRTNATEKKGRIIYGNSGYGSGGGVDELLKKAPSMLKKRGNLKASIPVIRKGKRDIESIRRVAKQNAALLRYQYNKRLRNNPDLKGTIIMHFAIDEFGKVIYCKPVKNTMNDEEFAEIISTRILRWIFPELRNNNEITEVEYPFVFED